MFVSYWDNVLRVLHMNAYTNYPKTQMFIPLSVTVYWDPPAFDLTEFCIWNFNMQGQFGDPDLHLQLGLQVTVGEVHKHSHPSPHLFAIHIDIVTPVWYLWTQRESRWQGGEERNENWSFWHTIENSILPKSIQFLSDREDLFEMDRPDITAEIKWERENILAWRGTLTLWQSMGRFTKQFIWSKNLQRTAVTNMLQFSSSRLNAVK